MQLTKALQLTEGEVVALVGAGGKTTALFRLADEIVAAGGRVITTTTTHLGADQLGRAPRHLSTIEANQAALSAALTQSGHVLVTGPVNTGLGRATGVTSGLIDAWQSLLDLTATLVEADGARGLPFKAPDAHEPAIPDAATLVVPVAGLAALGQPIAAGYVHRPERICALTGAAPGDPLTPELLAAVLAHPQGGLKNLPPAARVCVFLNQAETPEALAAARLIAARLLSHDRIEAVLIGCARRPDPVREVQARSAAIVLAAGRSTRMGRLKQLLPWGASTLLGEVVRRLGATSVADIIVVTGAEHAAVEASLRAAQSADARVRCVFNPDFAASEMARSLQVGLRALPPDRRAVLVALADQPSLEPGVVEAVLQRWRETGAAAVAPFFGEQRGHPLLLDRALWPRVLALPAEANPREAVRAAGAVLERVPVETDSILRDIDTPADYEQQAPLL